MTAVPRAMDLVLVTASFAITVAQTGSDGFSAVRSAFSQEQAKRREYTGTIKARLTVFSPRGGSETFPAMTRKVQDIEGGVCRQTASWADGKPVYEKQEVSKRCADLTSEFSGMEIEQLLGLNGYRLEAPRSAHRTFLRKGTHGSTCLASTDVRVEVAAGANHPESIKVLGGPECAANMRGLFRDGSTIEAQYALRDGVWQVTRLVEIHRAPFEAHDVMTEVEFFFRTFKAKGRLRDPMIRIEKEFSDYRHIDRARKLVANPVEGDLKEDSDVTIHYDLENEAKPEPAEPLKKALETVPRPGPK